MSNKRRGGLGRGLGALIPSSPANLSEDGSDTEAPSVAESPRLDAESGPGATSGVESSRPAGSDAANAPAPRPDSDPASAGPDDPAAGPDGRRLSQVPGATFAEIEIARVRANAKQPRQVFDEDALAELAHSIREFGVLQPIVVRPTGTDYELVMGERRLRAATLAGLESIPAIVRGTADDAMLRDALLENIHRAQLNPLEEAAAYQQLLQEFGTTHDELARRIGRSRPQVSNTIRLLNLPLAVQRRVAAGVLSAGHARALLSLDDRDAQDELASRIVAEGLSVRATEELVSLALRGDSPTKATRAAPARTFAAPAVEELARSLSDTFDTRVRVDIGRRKGRITVEFATIDDLERIVNVMAPDVAAQRNARAQPEG